MWEGRNRRHDSWGFGETNDEEDRIADCLVEFNIAIVNTWFQKKVNQLTTYKSGKKGKPDRLPRV